MAKSTMGLGQYHGRVGGLVYARGDNGSQIIRSYQPVVKNPRTDAQLIQRAKVNLAGRISALFAQYDIVSLGNNGRGRRSALLRNLIKSTTTELTNGNFVAKLSYSGVRISKGEYPLAVSSTPSIVMQGDDIMIDVRLQSSGVDIPDSDIVDVYILMTADNKPDYEPWLVRLSTADNSLTLQSGRVQGTFGFAPSLHGENIFASLYVVVRHPSATSSISTASVDGTIDIMSAPINVSSALSNYQYANSIYIGTIVTV